MEPGNRHLCSGVVDLRGKEVKGRSLRRSPQHPVGSPTSDHRALNGASICHRACEICGAGIGVERPTHPRFQSTPSQRCTARAIDYGGLLAIFEASAERNVALNLHLPVVALMDTMVAGAMLRGTQMHLGHLTLLRSLGAPWPATNTRRQEVARGSMGARAASSAVSPGAESDSGARASVTLAASFGSRVARACDDGWKSAQE